jgi:hypothetical protein
VGGGAPRAHVAGRAGRYSRGASAPHSPHAPSMMQCPSGCPIVSIRCLPSVQWLPSSVGAWHAARCHSTRSRSRLAPTWPPVRTTARQKTRGAAGAGASALLALAGRSPPVFGVGSIVVAAMACNGTSPNPDTLGRISTAIEGPCATRCSQFKLQH